MSAQTAARRKEAHDAGAALGEAGVEPDKKKRKLGTKKASAFKPQPIQQQQTRSSETPPEQDDSMTSFPPPPSERKIARRRESTRAIRERQPASPPPAAPVFASASRVPSPPSRTVSQPTRSGSMGPPGTGFVRKTRKSMASVHTEVTVDEVVTIPERETPMIRKNKELREAQQRRSSLGMRGQRASSSLGRGDLSIPHASVSSTQFYTHIAATQPEPIRARHLLVYCADRAFKADLDPSPSTSKGKSRTKKPDNARTEEGDKLMRDIMTDFLSGLGMGSVDTNVFASGPSTSMGVPLRPHPKNVSNRIAREREEAAIKRCRDECNDWGHLEIKTDREKSQIIERTTKKAALQATPDLSTVSGWMQDALRLAEEVIEAGEGDLTEMGEFPDVEYKVDTLHQSSHAALQFSQQASRYLDGIFASLTDDLRDRDRHRSGKEEGRGNDDTPDLTSVVRPPIASSSSTARDRDPIHMLRALASADSSEETIAAAASVAPAYLAQSTSATSATPRRPQAGPTPRRGLGTTPRRTGKTAGE